mmetsp:Transcript_11818/g.26011  ORF Transcript_11818/g.26011 Transcript_11818/m.26011 type:complete len:226 (-) Transcript_11818:1085-1762(-)
MQLGIFLVLQHCFQLVHIGEPLLRTQILGEDFAQRRIRTVNPSPGGHSVGHIHDLVWLVVVTAPLVELREGLLLNDLRVDGSHAIDLVGADHRQMPHADLLHVTLLHDAQSGDDGAVPIPLQELLDPMPIDMINNLQVPRQHALQHLHRPLFQGLWHDRVVGVVQALPGEVPCFVPVQLLNIHQQSHHLGHCDGGMGVVHLHRHLIRELFPFVVGSLDEFAQQVL